MPTHEQVFYHLGELDDALNYALGAGSLFDVEEPSEYVTTLVGEWPVPLPVTPCQCSSGRCSSHARCGTPQAWEVPCLSDFAPTIEGRMRPTMSVVQPGCTPSPQPAAWTSTLPSAPPRRRARARRRRWPSTRASLPLWSACWTSEQGQARVLVRVGRNFGVSPGAHTD